MKSYRIHRDVRFSPDKSPYKLWLGSLHTRPAGSMEYFHLDKSGLMVAAGAYMMEPAQLTRFRAALLDDAAGRKLERLAKKLAASEVVLDPGGLPPLKSAPRGVAADHPRIDWLRWKGCAAMGRFNGDLLADGPRLIEQMVGWWKTTEPLNVWLDEALG